MISKTKTNAYCVIGAGPCGLAATRQLAGMGIPVRCLERHTDLGGNWNCRNPTSSVYQSAHLISSKRLTEFPDFRMPREFPHYPSHTQALAYLRAYAAEYQLGKHIEYGCRVEQVVPAEHGWLVQVAGEPEPRTYAGVVIANGHHWKPLWPQLTGSFDGEQLHAHDYWNAEAFAGQRVLVIGAGNSGCDIAVEVSRVAARTVWSLRRGYHIFPKYLFGAPIDRCGDTMSRWWLPTWLARQITAWCIGVAAGRPERYGLPTPDHPMFASHPIVNSQILPAVGHGQVVPVGDVVRIEGRRVSFADGRSELIDTIICATGYELTFPFIDAKHLGWQGNAPRLFLNTFHPRYDSLFVVGMIQPDGGIWALADYQAQLVAQFVAAQTTCPSAARWFRRQIHKGLSSAGRARSYVDSPRHVLEVSYFEYRRRLRKLLRRFARYDVTPLEQASPATSRRSATWEMESLS